MAIVTSSVSRRQSRGAMYGAKLVLGSIGFAVLAIGFETALIIGLSVLTGMAYHLVAYGNAGSAEQFLIVGALASLLYTLPFLFRDEYRIRHYLDGHRNPGRTFLVWNYAFLCLGVIGFLTKTTEQFSRGWLLLFYVAGLAVLVVAAVIVKRVLKMLIRADRMACRRIMLVGSEEEIERMAAQITADRGGVRVVATAVLPWTAGGAKPGETGGLSEPLEAALANARLMQIDDVVILTDWSRAEFIHQIVEAFTVLPVSIHLGASSVIGRFTDARLSRFAALTALSLTEPPLGPLQAFTKRTFDIAAAAAALLLLSPLLFGVAALVKVTSPGPVFFRQRRLGYNLKEFRIWKFRTMTTMEDGDQIPQAKAGDVRVTRLGHYLRRFSIDELPQLWNVLKGEMSLVGPRPHAVAHDRIFEKRIVSYPRRLNVRPGITGWAQVNGLRGATGTDDAMRRRVEYDLHYIDNWSIALDLYIIALTLLSPNTYRNAH